MNQIDIQHLLLQKLYLSFFGMSPTSNIFEIAKGVTENQDLVLKVTDYLHQENLIAPHALGGYFRIAPKGVLFVEERNLCDANVVAENRQVRTRILKTLADYWRQKGSRYTLSYNAILSQNNFDDSELIKANLMFLLRAEMIESGGSATFRLTHTALEQVEAWEKRVELQRQFEQIKTSKPQQRGHHLETLLADLITQEGWTVEKTVKTSNEELDLILVWEKIYFLAECKWEKNPIESGAISKLFGRLNKRVSVQGVFFSVSGFSRGAIQEILEHSNQRVILAFGENDIGRLFNYEATFSDLMSTKYHAMVTRKEVVFA